jgi:hypothetical protein
MTFTDDDLRKEKEKLNGHIAHCGFTEYPAHCMDINCRKQEALLARLEAAEYLIKLKDYGEVNRKQWLESHQLAWKAWRKVAGK